MKLRHQVTVALFLACVLSGWHWAHSTGHGCKIVSRDDDYVEIAEESAIIVWDASAKTQHFIRWVSFATEAQDFGFLVPTPTKPVLAEATETAFQLLNDLIKPETVNQLQVSLFCVPTCSKMPAPVDSIGDVRVLDEQRIGGFDTVVLEADDAQALGNWLKHYGYSADPDWRRLDPYVKKNWKITAFKIAQDP